MNRKPRIVVVGSANTDMLFKGESLPRAGETIFGTGFDLGFGGKGANQAVAASLCGAEVAMIAAVGDDLLGVETISNFESLGVDASRVRVVPGIATGAAFILVEPSGENRIIVAKGANDRLAPADVDNAASVIAAADMVLLQFEIPVDTVCRSIEVARTHGVPCMLNPAPALATSPEALAGARYLVLNETEAEVMTGRDAHTESGRKRCIDDLLAKGFRQIVLTLGAKGAIVASAARRSPIPPFPVNVVDTTGAGDAFIGSLATFLAEGEAEEEAATRASLYAALSATRTGTQKSFMRRSEFVQELERRRKADNGAMHAA